MALLLLRDVNYAYGPQPLLDSANMTVEQGEKIALIGRNGAGKSTLLRLLNLDGAPDSGEIIRQQGLTTMLLTQQVPTELSGKVVDIITSALARDGALLARFHYVTSGIAEAYEAENYPLAESLQKELDRLQHELDVTGAWESQRKVESVLQKIGIGPNEEIATLSAGKKRRVLFGKAIVAEPDVLLLDEPTNHLDLDSTLWLEDFLKKYEKTIVFITHDRMFLRRVATSIWELDRGHLFRYDCDYDTFLERREQRLHAEEKELEHFNKKLAQEEVWIRTGIMARRTRNEGRVRALKEMRRQSALVRKDPGVAKLQIQEGVTTGRLVIGTEKLGFQYAPGAPFLFHDLTLKIMRGDRVGILGPNGVGKTTLLKVLLNELPTTHGTVRHGTQLQIAYFDQLHATLDEEASAVDNVSDGTTHLSINGGKQHVLGYLRDFLFSEDRAKMPIKFLSGGEKNRLLLAKLFTKPSNILVMDEPTNDLDMETLDLLEGRLSQYQGTLLLVSHDREFINNVVTSTLVFEGNGEVHEYAGGYDDWLIQRPQEVATPVPSKSSKPVKKESRPANKLTYMEQKELEALPAQIEACETLLSELNDRMSDPELFQRDEREFIRLTHQAGEVQAQLDAHYARWEALDARG